MIELFECGPMMAKISRKQCAYNRKQIDDHGGERLADARCRKCAGLGVAVTIDPEEIMARKHCSEIGCTTVTWKDGFCWKHHPEHVANKAAARADKQAIRDIHKAAALPPLATDYLAPIKTTIEKVIEQEIPIQVATVDVQPVMVLSAAEITNIDYIAYLRQLLDEKLESWVVDLNSARTPRERSQFYLNMCDAVEDLGY